MILVGMEAGCYSNYNCICRDAQFSRTDARAAGRFDFLQIEAVGDYLQFFVG